MFQLSIINIEKLCIFENISINKLLICLDLIEMICIDTVCTYTKLIDY